MSIVGFDNIYLNEYMIPRITTVGINLKEVGKYAVDILYQRLNGKNPEKVIELETQLVIRDSCIIAKSEKEL